MAEQKTTLDRIINIVETSRLIEDLMSLDIIFLRRARRDVRAEDASLKVNYINVENTELGLDAVAIIEAVSKSGEISFSPLRVQLSNTILESTIVEDLNNYSSLCLNVLSERMASNSFLKNRMESFLINSDVNNVTINSNGQIVKTKQI